MYSSGMFARLAFSVMIHVEPDVLIIDEALSVGDAAFTVKCMKEIKKFTECGVSVLFVSHDMTSVRSLCNSVVWIDNGVLKDIGDVEKISNDYIKSLHIDNNIEENSVDTTKDDKQVDTTNDYIYLDKKNNSIWGNNEIEILSYVILDENNLPTKSIKTGEKIKININIISHIDIQNTKIGFGVSFRNKNGLDIIVPTSIEDGVWLDKVKKDRQYQLSIEFMNPLIQGEYIMTLQVEKRDSGVAEYYQFVENATTVDVLSSSYYFGLAYSYAKFDIRQIHDRK
jgi:ABC-type Fe3+/spermidine/putrescine transport system ATPase subunit